MAAITPAMVKELRDKTDAGMLECKKALVENNGDMEAAVEALRKAGIAKAEKRADRATKEGRICIATNGGKAAMVEILCETDFVANNEKFADFCQQAAQDVLNKISGSGDVTAAAAQMEAEDLAALFSKFGEKMSLSRAARFETSNQLATYIYGNGKIALVVEMAGELTDELKKNVCLHITAFNPRYVCSAEVPADVLAKEKEIAAAQLAESGKPANMIEKILGGKMNKWYSEVCFVDQPWIHDDKSSFAKLYPKAKVISFTRWVAGQDF